MTADSRYSGKKSRGRPRASATRPARSGPAVLPRSWRRTRERWPWSTPAARASPRRVKPLSFSRRGSSSARWLLVRRGSTWAAVWSDKRSPLSWRRRGRQVRVAHGLDRGRRRSRSAREGGLVSGPGSAATAAASVARSVVACTSQAACQSSGTPMLGSRPWARAVASLHRSRSCSVATPSGTTTSRVRSAGSARTTRSRSSSTAWRRNSGGYGGRVLGVDTSSLLGPCGPSVRVSTEAGQVQTASRSRSAKAATGAAGERPLPVTAAAAQREESRPRQP